MVNFTFIAGGYTSFVASYLFNSDANTLSLLNNYTTGDDPSWIISHPTNRSIFYATNEFATGALQSFTVTPDGVVSAPVDTVSSGGDGPAFCGPLPVGGQVAIVNYNSGNGRIIPTTTDPLHFATNATEITFPPPAGGVSHPHMALQHGSEVFVSDLGADKVWRLGEDGDPGTWSIHGFIEQPEGSGPRHIAIYDEELYVLHELASTLTVQAIPSFPNGTTPLLANVSIIPPNPPAGAAFAAGEILIPTPSAKFPTPYIYVSNRNTGTQDPRGDAINVYERQRGNATEGLKLVAQVFTGLDQIRGMEFGREDNGGDEYLAASGVAGTAGVIVLKRTQGGAGLEIVANNTVIPTRTSFVWL